MYIFLLAPVEGLFSNRNIGKLFKYIFFVLFFCLLLHRPAVRISLPFHIFPQKHLASLKTSASIWKLASHTYVLRGSSRVPELQTSIVGPERVTNPLRTSVWEAIWKMECSSMNLSVRCVLQKATVKLELLWE